MAALSIAISFRNCCLGYPFQMCPYAVAATYVKMQLGMHIRGLQRWASKFVLSCPWVNEALYPTKIWDSLPMIQALRVASIPFMLRTSNKQVKYLKNNVCITWLIQPLPWSMLHQAYQEYKQCPFLDQDLVLLLPKGMRHHPQTKEVFFGNVLLLAQLFLFWVRNKTLPDRNLFTSDRLLGKAKE